MITAQPPPPQEIPAIGIEIDPPLITFAPGDTVALEALLTPSNSTDGVEWESSDPDVVELEYDGYSWLAVAIAEGEATITATADSGVTAEALVVIEEAAYESASGVVALMGAGAMGVPEDFWLGSNSDILAPGEQGTLYGWFYPEESSDNVTWISSDPGVVAVGAINTDENPILCTIEGISIGTATITATTDGGLDYSIGIEVLPLAGSISLSPSPLTVREGKNVYLSVVYPEGTFGMYDMTYNNDDVNAFGPWMYDTGRIAVRGQEVGTGTITVSMQSAPEKTATVQVEVVDANTNPATSITLDCWFNENNFALGEDDIIAAQLFPADATDLIEWESSDLSVVSVESYREYDGDGSVWGMVTAEGPGTATITLRAEGGATGTVDITVSEGGGGPVGEATNIEIDVGDVLQLGLGATNVGISYIIDPPNAADTIVWSSGDENILEIRTATEEDGEWAYERRWGIATAKALGETTVTVTAVESGISCTKPAFVVPMATGITAVSPVNLLVNQTKWLQFSYTPEGSTGIYSWYSMDENIVASVDVDGGNIRGVSEGTTTVRIELVDGNGMDTGIYADVEVIVWPEGTTFAAEDIWLDTWYGDYLWLPVGATEGAWVEVFPEGATDEVTWSSSNTSVATVQPPNQPWNEGFKTAFVTAHRQGTATITASIPNGQSVSFTVEVPRAATGFTLPYTSYTMRLGRDRFFGGDPVFTPAGSALGLEWSSDNPSVAMMHDYGRLETNGTGTATITAKGITNPGITRSFTLNVVDSNTKPATLFRMDATVIELAEDWEGYWWRYIMEPRDATDNITWTSSDENVFVIEGYDVDDVGLSAVGLGTATLTGVTEGGLTTTATVYVKPNPTDIALNYPTLTMRQGEFFNLDYSLTPADAIGWPDWWSNNATIVSVEDGRLYAARAGTATIYATLDNGLQASCVVTVVTTNAKPAEALTFRMAHYILEMGSDAWIDLLHKEPEDTTDKATVTSSSTAVVTVTRRSDGIYVLSPKRAGTATLTATSECKKHVTTAMVTVVPRATGMSFPGSPFTVRKGEYFRNRLVSAIQWTPATADAGWATYTSSDEGVVSTGYWGYDLVAEEVGQATITARLISNPNVSATVDVNVVDTNTVEVTSIGIGDMSLQLKLTGYSAKADIQPLFHTDKIIWNSLNPSIVQINGWNDDGRAWLVPKAVGTAIVEITAVDSAITKQVAVTVVDERPTLSFSETSFAKLVGDELNEQPVITFTTATAPPLLDWTTSNAAVATVDNFGAVTCVGAGTAVITAYMAEFPAVRASYTVTVTGKVTAIRLDKTSVTQGPDSEFTLTAITTPANSTEELVWMSNDPANFTITPVGDTGKVVRLNIQENAPRNGLVTVRTVDNRHWVQCIVTVRRVATGISLDETELLLAVGDQSTLTWALEPADADDRISGRTSNARVATVTNSSTVDNPVLQVTAVGVGTATLTFTTQAGATATCVVTVREPVTGITLNPPSANVIRGRTLQLRPIITPANGTDRLTWESSDDSFATVTPNGLVTARGVGTATITARTAFGVSAQSTITVIVPATAIRIPATLRVKMGEAPSLASSVILTPADSTDGVTWTSAAPLVAIVDTNTGVITTEGPGTARITARTTSGRTAVCTVTVWKNPDEVELNANTPLNGESFDLGRGKTRQLGFRAVPALSVCRALATWSSSNTAVATVSAAGLVRGVNTGEATITLQIGDMTPFTWEVNVQTPSTAVRITPPDGLTAIPVSGGTLQLAATLTPLNSTDTITWSSNNSDVAVVDSTGQVTAVTRGTAIITATTTSGRRATVTVTVYGAATNPTITSPTAGAINLERGKTVTMRGTVAADPLPVCRVWTSSDPSVASVHPMTGVVRAVSTGSATIIFGTGSTTPSGGPNERHITVTTAATGVTLSSTTLNVEIGKEFSLTGTIAPVGSTTNFRLPGQNPAPTTSSNVAVVQVLDAERITLPDLMAPPHTRIHTLEAEFRAGPNPGKATLTFFAMDGKRATCAVTVWKEADTTSLLPATTTASNPNRLELNRTVQLRAVMTPAGTNTPVKWESSDETVATVSATGLVRAVGLGNAEIRLYSMKAGSVWATEPDARYYVVGTRSATSIRLDKARMTLDISAVVADATGLLTPTLLPVGNNSTVTWASNRDSVATVDENGVVTSVGPGAATITATTSSGRRVTCAVTVVRSATSLEVKEEGAGAPLLRTTIARNTTIRAIATVEPVEGTTDKITWTTSNNKVATVTPRVVSGQLFCDIRGMGLGDAIVTVRIGAQVYRFAVTVSQ
ncbi:MAG: Ig-like domain-containing protein [Clostridia bacterium]|nr:Ig-like domain-containing protein [Clostridia bacterium]